MTGTPKKKPYTGFSYMKLIENLYNSHTSGMMGAESNVEWAEKGEEVKKWSHHVIEIF